MADLNVGDIEIRGSVVRIRAPARPPGGPHEVTPMGRLPGPAADSAALPPRLALAAWLRPIPGTPALLAGIGGSLIAIGAIGAVTGGLSDPLAFVRHAVFLLPAGVTIAAVAAAKHWTRRPGAFAAVMTHDGVEARIEQLSRVLARHDRTHTVRGIARHLGWSETDVVRALAWLRERGALLEDFDVTTGEFYYAADPQPRDLDARIRHLITSA